MKKGIKWLILAIFMILPSSALALTGYSGEMVVLEKDEVINSNYYAAGTIVEINGTVNGDIFVAGETVVIDSENINGDVFAAASNINIRGNINGSLRLAGENIDVMAQVSGNAMVAGQNLRIDSSSNLSGHLTYWGQMVNVAGQVGRLEGAFNKLRLSGRVENDADIYVVDQKQDAVYIADEAFVGGTLYYQALKKMDINSEAEISNISFNEILKKEKSTAEKVDVFGCLFKFFSMLLIGMIILHLWPKLFSDVYRESIKSPIKNLFKGLLYLIVVPIVSILVAVTIIGVPLAIIILLLWGITVYLAKIFTAWFIANLLKSKFFASRKCKNMGLLIIGIFVYLLIGKIPFIGSLVIAVAYLITLGSIFNIIKFKKD